MGEAHHVTHWPIVEASLTPTPAEPHCVAVALKSLVIPDLGEYEPGAREYEPASLAERTERWLDRGQELLVGYRQVKAQEVKAGKPQLSAARRARLDEIHRLVGDLLSETAPARDVPDEIRPEWQPKRKNEVFVGGDETPQPAAGMDAVEPSPSEPEPLGSDLYAMLVATEFSGTSWTEGAPAP